MPAAADAGDVIERIRDVPVNLRVSIGSVTISVAQLAELGKGAVLTLERRVGEPVELTVNGRPFARGELVVRKEDMQFGFKVDELLSVSEKSGSTARG